MDIAALLINSFDRIGEEVAATTTGLSRDELSYRPDGTGNSIAWLVWHLSRVQDDHVAEAAGHDQVWIEQGWADRFDLSLPAYDTGYGHEPADVAKVTATAELLTGYHNSVHDQTVRYVSSLTGADLDRIVDDAYDPPVTLGVRLISVISDDLQHIGQAAYIRGLQHARTAG